MTQSAAPLSPEDFALATGVSRETLDRLSAYAALLTKWQPAINLVGGDTLADLWRRHFLDSAQLWPLIPPGARSLVDLGSGAGFPGLVLAILGVPEVHLIESDQRKAAFLREAARVAGAVVTVHARPILSVPGFPADVVTARALAPVARLLDLSERFRRDGTLCLFLKGRALEAELTAAAESWKIHAERVTSRSDPAGIILVVKSSARTGGKREGG